MEYMTVRDTIMYMSCINFTRYKQYNFAGSDTDMGIHAHTRVHDCLLLIVPKIYLKGDGVGDWPGGGDP
jgi:hypothetical protein